MNTSTATLDSLGSTLEPRGYRHLVYIVVLLMTATLIVNSSAATDSVSDLIDSSFATKKFSVYYRGCSRSQWSATRHPDLKSALEVVQKRGQTGSHNQFVSTGNRLPQWAHPATVSAIKPTSCSVCVMSGTDWSVRATTKLAADATLLAEALRKSGAEVEVVYHYPATLKTVKSQPTR